jgi:hypothetical protein
MIHYQCYTCGMNATCVLTESANLAWLDHMANHAVPANYGRWTWTAVQLEVGQGAGG